MTHVKKFILDSNKALAYFKYNLEDVNLLSTSLLKLLESKKGEFFSYLPSSTKLDEENNLNTGIVFRGINGLTKNMILENLQNNKNIFCMFDDFSSSTEIDYLSSLFTYCGYTYEKEVYYAINHLNANSQVIDECFFASQTGWHSICLLSKFNFIEILDRKLSIKNIEEICAHTDLIMIEAYDGEGYACWCPIN